MNGPLVVKIGGAGVESPREAGALWRAVAEAHRLLHGQLVLVHGGGRAVDRHLDRLGLATRRIGGLRATPAEQMQEVAAVLAGRVNKALVGALVAAGVPAVGLCLGDGGALRCAAHPVRELERVGEVAGGEAGLLRTLMGAGFLPVLCSIGFDDAGEFLNINADDAAAGAARALSARALVLLTDVEGVRGRGGETVESIDKAGIEALIAEGVIEGGMVPKARAAAGAAGRAGGPAYIASFNRPEDLVRLASGEHVGTRVMCGGRGQE